MNKRKQFEQRRIKRLPKNDKTMDEDKDLDLKETSKEEKEEEEISANRE